MGRMLRYSGFKFVLSRIIDFGVVVSSLLLAELTKTLQVQLNAGGHSWRPRAENAYQCHQPPHSLTVFSRFHYVVPVLLAFVGWELGPSSSYRGTFGTWQLSSFPLIVQTKHLQRCCTHEIWNHTKLLPGSTYIPHSFFPQIFPNLSGFVKHQTYSIHYTSTHTSSHHAYIHTLRLKSHSHERRKPRRPQRRRSNR
jgi:hypothetical protein